MTTQITLPPNTRVAGGGSPAPDMDQVVTALMAMSATSYCLPTGDTTGTSDPVNLNAALAANSITVLGPGTYYLNATVGPLATGQWVVCMPGVFISWLGTGDCFRFVDTSTYTTRTRQGAGILGRPVIDGTSAGAGSTGLHAGDILGLRFDIAVQNFTGAGDIAVYLDNENYWTEQAIGTAYIAACTQDVVFNCGGASTSAGSFDRGDFTFCVSRTLFTGNSVTWQNGAYQVGGRFRLFGNYASSASAFTQSVLAITGSAPGGHPASSSGLAQCEIDINIESDGGLAHTFQTINFGSTANTIVNCSGNVSFGPGNQFGASNITSLATQYTFVGPTIGDSTLSEVSLPGRLSVPSQAFFFSSLYLGGIGAPATPVGGGLFYTDTLGNGHYKGPGGTDTIVAGSAGTVNAASVSYYPSNPAGTVSATAVMMGLGTTCVFTPKNTGKVRVTMCGTWYTAGTAVAGIFGGRYGTGTAPANGVASTGTRFGTGTSDSTPKTASTGNGMFFSITDILSLAAGTAYWFDLAEASAAGDTTETGNIVCTIDELVA